jgi:hypothetical protein
MKTSKLSVLITVILLIYAAGCKNEPQQDSSHENQSSESAKGGHSHGSGPNGGAIADWGGGKYHAEFTVDHDKKQATVYILDSNAKLPAPIKASELVLSINDPEFDVELTPQPLEGETDGVSSRFVGQHDNLGIVQEFAGTISGEVDGMPYAGDFREEPRAE